MVLWGLVSLLTAEAKSYGSILAIRLILGIFEAVFYPGALFTLSKFYTRSELALRSSFFYGAALLASAFGSLFAAVGLSERYVSAFCTLVSFHSG